MLRWQGSLTTNIKYCADRWLSVKQTPGPPSNTMLFLDTSLLIIGSVLLADCQFGRRFSATEVTRNFGPCGRIWLCAIMTPSSRRPGVDSWLDWRCVCRKRSQWRTSRLALVRLKSDRLSPKLPIHRPGF